MMPLKGFRDEKTKNKKRNRSGGKIAVFSLKERFPYILLAILA